MHDPLILGISLSHNSSAAFVTFRNRIVFAASQERIYSEKLDFNYIKNDKVFPVGVIQAGISNAGINPAQVRIVTWSHYEKPDLYNFLNRNLSSRLRKLLEACSSNRKEIRMILNMRTREELCRFRREYTGEQQLQIIHDLFLFLLDRLFGIKPEKIVRINHHICHAYGALKTSGFSDGALVISLDGFGDNASGKAFRVKDERLHPLEEHTIPAIGSPGLFYQYATGNIRLKNGERLTMLQDEYKLLGMEPHAQKNYAALNFFIDNVSANGKNRIIWNLDKSNESLTTAEQVIHPVDETPVLEKVQAYFNRMLGKARGEGFSEFDVAHGVQKRFEEVVLCWIRGIIGDEKRIRLALGGGCFYNVKLNYLIKQLPGVERLWIFPAAGDEGNAAGSAFAYIAEHINAMASGITHMNLGKKYDKTDMETAFAFLEKRLGGNLNYELIPSMEERIARITDLLVSGKIVHIADLDRGVEFGPRALCCRSTLSRATSRDVNEAIREMFCRYQYMPLAPVIKAENAVRVVMNFDPETDGEISRYMIIAYPCTAEFTRCYPAVVHPYHPDDWEVFGEKCSCRPQVVNRDRDAFAWKILDAYERKTGEIALVNTSFNSHNSPILGDPVIFLLDWLSMGHQSCLFAGDYFFDFHRNRKLIDTARVKWNRAKHLKTLAYSAFKKRML